MSEATKTLGIPDNIDLSGIVVLDKPLIMHRRKFAYDHLDCGILITDQEHGNDSEIIAYSTSIGSNSKLIAIYNEFLRGKSKYRYYTGVSSSEVNSIV